MIEPRSFEDLAGESAERLAAELMEHCRGGLAGFKCPTSIEFRELPRTSTGKLSRVRLREDVLGVAG
jgi:acyl-CoA synthetase (AMP-forming)/AMP-acid ligase II